MREIEDQLTTLTLLTIAANIVIAYFLLKRENCFAEILFEMF